jgi:hypothetical protein
MSAAESPLDRAAPCSGPRARDFWRLDLDLTARELGRVLEARIEADGWSWNPLLSLAMDGCTILRDLATASPRDEDPT